MYQRKNHYGDGIVSFRHTSSCTDRYFGEDVEYEREDGEVHAYAVAAEAFLDVLGHGEDARRDVDRHEQPAQHQHHEYRLPLMKCDRQHVDTCRTYNTAFT